MPKNKSLIKVPFHKLSFLKILLERIINLFISTFYWNGKLEQKLYNLCFWKRKDQLGYRNIKEFKNHFNFKQINWCKNDQAYMLRNLTQSGINQYRSKMRTKIFKYIYFFSKSKRASLFDVLLIQINGSSRNNKKRGVKRNSLTSPLLIANNLEKKGLKVYFYDIKSFNGLKDFKKFIEYYFPKVIGIYIPEEFKKQALKIIKLCQNMDLMVIVFGPDPSNLPQFYIDYGANIVIIGEAQETLLEILKYIKNPTKPLTEIEGIYTNAGFSKSCGFIKNPNS